MVEFEISEFNINHAAGFRDEKHIELLKKQIEGRKEILVDVYKEPGRDPNTWYIIDGGHAYYAYQRLRRVPTVLDEKHFELDSKGFLTERGKVDAIAHSRHKNMNRLQATPVAYTKSIFAELKLRLGVENDEEVKSILGRYFNLVSYPNRYTPTDEDSNNNVIITEVFAPERVKPRSFVQNNLAYLDFPDWLAKMVDKQQLSAEQGRRINHRYRGFELSDDQKRRVADASAHKSVEFTMRLIGELLPSSIPRTPSSLSIAVDRQLYHDLEETFESLLSYQLPNFLDEFNEFAKNCLELGLGIWIMKLTDLRERQR